MWRFGLILMVAVVVPSKGADSLNVKLVGSCDTPGLAMDLAVSGSYAYIADFHAGLRVIDVSNPANPVEVGFYDTPGEAVSVAVSASHAYIADKARGLRVIDIADPANPVEVGFLEIHGVVALGVAVSGSYAYIAGRCEGLRVIDIADPANPVEVGFLDTPERALSVEVSGSYAYVADRLGGLRVIDVSNPINPVEVGSYYPPVMAVDVVVSGSFAYVAAFNEGLRVVDISDPSSPVETGYCDTPGWALGVAFSYPFAYIGDDGFGLRVIDVSYSPPGEVGFYNTPSEAGGVTVSGHYVYVADVFSGLLILENLLVPALPSLIAPDSGSYISNIIPTFVWHASDRATKYRIKIDGDTVETLDTTYTPPPLSEGTHFWCVKAGVGDNWSDYSSIWTVTVDTTSPVIDSTTELPDTVEFFGPFTVNTKIIDNFSIKDVILYFRINSGEWVVDTMTPTGDNWYTGEIAEQTPADTIIVEYYITALDSAGNIARDPKVANYSFTLFLIGIEERMDIPDKFVLFSPKPNPSVGMVEIKYGLPEKADIGLSIYDIQGRLVDVIHRGKRDAGYHKFKIDSRDLSSGIYFIRFDTPEFAQIERLIILQ